MYITSTDVYRSKVGTKCPVQYITVTHTLYLTIYIYNYTHSYRYAISTTVIYYYATIYCKKQNLMVKLMCKVSEKQNNHYFNDILNKL